jgi:HmuY protein
MLKKNLIKVLFFCASVTAFFSACRKRDAIAEADNFIVFETATKGIGANENAVTIKLRLSRPTTVDIPVTITVGLTGLANNVDVNAIPAIDGNTIKTTIPSGNNEATITIAKLPGVLFDGDEQIKFIINSSGAPVIIGNTKEFTLSFAELVATSSAYTINGGGATYPNKVFIDLSANRQIGVQRTNWDLSFSNAITDYRVLLNAAVGMMAKQIAKSDLNLVTTADTVGFGADVAYSQTNPLISQLGYIDYPNGDVTKNALGEVTIADNKVYIINRGNTIGLPSATRGWKKIKIERNASGGYILRHADINATSFTSVEINKDAAYFFKHFSFENGIVPIEPEKKKWDLAWSYFGNVTNFGAGEVPYLFQDFIVLNKNVASVKVLTSTISFSAFDSTQLATQTFSTAQNAIGSDWRSGGGPTSAPAVRTDRFYIIKDGDNNYYKLRFTSLTDGGVRGYPATEYVLVKKG